MKWKGGAPKGFTVAVLSLLLAALLPGAAAAGDPMVEGGKPKILAIVLNAPQYDAAAVTTGAAVATYALTDKETGWGYPPWWAPSSSFSRHCCRRLRTAVF